METKTKKSTTSTTAKTNGNPQKKSTPKPTKAVEKKEASKKIDALLNVSADSRIKKLETFNLLAKKKERVDTKLDELTNFRVSNDGTNQKMEFSADNGYRFTISNNKTINELLNFIETELSKVQATTESEIINFNI